MHLLLRGALRAVPGVPASLMLLLLLAGALFAGGCSKRFSTTELHGLIGVTRLSHAGTGDFAGDSADLTGPILVAGADTRVKETSPSGGIRAGGRLVLVPWAEEGFVNIFGSDYEVSVFSAQATASYRQTAGSLFMEPGAGAGLAHGTATRQSGFHRSSSETDLSWIISPFLRVGVLAGRVRVGLEAGYQATGLSFGDDFGRTRGGPYLGGFLGIRLGR